MEFNIREFIKDNILVLDGAMGTMLQSAGLKIGENPNVLNVENPDLVKEVHMQYLKAGSNMILTNTFGANKHKMGDRALELIRAGVRIAREAVDELGGYVALNIGPIGELLEPVGTLNFDDAYDDFKTQILAGVKAGVDAIYIETMTDLAEGRCAVLAARENCSLPVFCTMSFEQNMHTFMGTDISSMALTLEGVGADFIGINCSVGPAEIFAMAKEITKWTNLPIIIKPNAGMPSIIDGEAVFSATADEFAREMGRIVDLGISVIGGCCGTTPEFIARLKEIANKGKRVKTPKQIVSAVCSSSKTVIIDRVRVVGERINPTGKKLFQQALKDNDMDYIINQAVEQVDAGGDILDINVGLPGLCEKVAMQNVVRSLQGVVRVPLQIDSSNVEAIEAGLRAFTGKAIVNSVNGDDKVLSTILPIVKKYGAAVVGLALDENGIPKTAQARFEIAQRIVETALLYGIAKEDVYIDCLTLTSGAEQTDAYQVIDTLRLVKEHLGVKTILGVSNISFGLPARGTINQVFLSLALANGLDLPIMNPNEKHMMDTVYCYHQLKNIDKGSYDYIERFDEQPTVSRGFAADSMQHDIAHCIENGLKEEIKDVVYMKLKEKDGLYIVNEILIPALDDVGDRYESGKIFLPQLLHSAEAAKVAFEIVNKSMPKESGQAQVHKEILLATVEGDVHDIGKNIVKVVLENYGYKVIDLGRDVKISVVADEAVRRKVKLVGLSALMTTTVGNMKKTIAAIKEKDSSIIVVVGGAVLNEEYAKEIKADYYAKDAMSMVAIAGEVFDKN